MAQTYTTWLTPSSGVRSGWDALVENYNKAYGEARAANESRYQQMLGIADQTTQQRATDVRSSFSDARAASSQKLGRLGMSGTTVGSTLDRGSMREEESSLNRLADQMQQTKLGIIERREDKYPDQGSLVNLLSGAASQYGQGQGLPALFKALSGLQQG